MLSGLTEKMRKGERMTVMWSGLTEKMRKGERMSCCQD